MRCAGLGVGASTVLLWSARRHLSGTNRGLSSHEVHLQGNRAPTWPRTDAAINRISRSSARTRRALRAQRTLDNRFHNRVCGSWPRPAPPGARAKSTPTGEAAPRPAGRPVRGHPRAVMKPTVPSLALDRRRRRSDTINRRQPQRYCPIADLEAGRASGSRASAALSAVPSAVEGPENGRSDSSRRVRPM